MGHARKAALHLLSNDWSRAVWKHWLSNIFLPPVDPPVPSQPPGPVAPSERVNTAPSIDASRVALDGSCAEPKSDPPDAATSAREGKRSELRARFEALSDRLGAVEDGLDTLLRRSAQREKSERRAELQQVEAVDQVAVAAERQAAALEGLLGTVARLEHGLSRLEHGLSRLERALSEQRRDSRFTSAGSQPPQRGGSQFPESPVSRERPSSSERPSDIDEAYTGEASGINGVLSEVSLSTVMAMLEIERHTGRLKVAANDGMLASFELAEGNVVSSRLSENDTDPLQTLRTALCWKQGRFWFRQQPPESTSFPPRSIGSLLLEATRQNDESFADVG